jgi:hypothetical protein
MNKFFEKMMALSDVGRRIIIIFTLIFAVFLTFISITSAIDMNRNNDWLENVEFIYGGTMTYFAMLPWVLGLSYLLYKKFNDKSSILYQRKDRLLWALPYLLTLFVLAAGTLWVYSVQSAPTHDSWIVTTSAKMFSQGDYSMLEGDYLQRFPFQLGYVLFTEFFVRFLGGSSENLLYLQAINVACLAVAYLGIVRITEITFRNKTVTLFTTILLFLCFQPIMFSTFLYGNTPGFLFSVLSIWLALLYFEKRKIWQAVFSAVCIGLAVMIKWSNLIILVALCIMIILNVLHKNQLRKSPKQALVSLCFLVLAITLGIGMNTFAITHYESRSGIKIADGVPMTAWLAMGLSEAFVEAGWFDANHFGMYEVSGRSQAAVSEVNMQAIKERVDTFTDDPDYAMRFFYRKFASQWNEATFQSIWTNQVRGHYGDGMSGIAELVCGEWEYAVKGYMNIYNTIIISMFTAGLFCSIRKKRLAFAFLPLIILGGFLYYTLFEAKSQYALLYFVMMIPAAGFGLYSCVKFIDKKIEKFKKEIRQHEIVCAGQKDNQICDNSANLDPDC